MNIDLNYISQFKSVIEDIVDTEIKNAGITTYIAAIVQKINDDGTVDCYLPPDKNNLVTGIFNRCGEILYVGDSVEIATKNGSLTNAWVFVKHGTNIIGYQKDIDAFGTSVVLKVANGRLTTTALAQDASLGNSFTIVSDDINLDGMNINLNGSRGITISSPYFNVTKTGWITSTGGEIGGWTIGDTKLYSGSGTSYVRLDSNPNVGSAIWCGAETATQAPFRVTKAGAIKATSGNIAGWELNSNYLNKTFSNGAYSIQLRTDSASNDPSILVYDHNNTRYNWFVRPDGYMYARNAEINGTINANNGSIGGWTISNSALYTTNNNYYLGTTGITATIGGTSRSNIIFKAGSNFGVDSSGNLYSNNATLSSATVSGEVNATSGTFSNVTVTDTCTVPASTVTGTLSTNNIPNLSANKITTGTLNGNNVSVTNLSASNITGGTLTAASISLNSGTVKLRTNGHVEFTNGVGFFTMGPEYGGATGTTHPYVSRLNIAAGSNIISFRSSESIGSTGSQLNSITCSGNYLNIGSSDSSQGVQIIARNSHGVNINGGSGSAWINIVGTTITGSGGADMFANSNCAFQPASGYYAYVGSTSSNSNRIATSSSGPSSLNVKKNLVDMKDEYSLIYDDLHKVNSYNYDYKYKGIKDELTKDYGFIIDEIESTEYLSKYFRNYDVDRWLDGDVLRKQTKDEEDMSSYEKIEVKEWERDSYIKGLFVLIKSLQYKIDELEEKIEKGD